MEQDTNPNIDMSDDLASQVVGNLRENNYLGEGAAGKVYRIDYYGIQSVAKIPVNENKKESLKKEATIYSHVCKIFNRCACSSNIVQMLGYNNRFSVIMLEYFDGSDLTKYTGYPVSDQVFLTHRLLPRSMSGKANFNTLAAYLPANNPENIILKLFDPIVSGIICLHGAKILHKDFELKNVLIRSDGKVGIADFGLSRMVGKGETYSEFSQLVAGFKGDTDKLGAMMGDFVDSDNPVPYQYRLDSGPVDNIPILEKIQNPQLSDAFLLLTEFKELVSFISTIYYINLNTDFSTGKNLIIEAAEFFNDIIDEDPDLDESEKKSVYIDPNKIEDIMNILYKKLRLEPKLTDLINYFRLVINQILIMIGSEPVPEGHSVFEHLKVSFSDQYVDALRILINQITDGFALRNINLFMMIFA